MKFLVMWELAVVGLRAETVRAVMKMPEYAKGLTKKRKLLLRYHTVGKHGGAWVYDVTSNEELEHLLAMAPVYNYARFDIVPLAEMETPADVLQPAEEPSAA